MHFEQPLEVYDYQYLKVVNMDDKEFKMKIVKYDIQVPCPLRGRFRRGHCHTFPSESVNVKLNKYQLFRNKLCIHIFIFIGSLMPMIILFMLTLVLYSIL